MTVAIRPHYLGALHAALLLLWGTRNVSGFQVPLSSVVDVSRHCTVHSPRQRPLNTGTITRSKSCYMKSANVNDHDNDNQGGETGVPGVDRRNFLASAVVGTLAGVMMPPLQPAHAGALMQFPCIRPLKNRYHFMRAGPSELELEGIWSTNPLFLTNRENALANNREAQKIVLDACEAIKASGHLPTVAYHSLAANGIDTADLIGQQLRMGRDRILPEFTYLDPRGVGMWDSSDVTIIQPAVWALDVLEAGREGTGGRPPANEDGTPNETLADQFVRLRQFLSLQESRTSGENILIIFPDGTGPALLSAMIAGIPLYDVHTLEYAPGEVRLDITRDSVLQMYASKKEDPTYLAIVEEGKEKLSALRKQKSMVSLKDQRAEQDRLDMEEAFLRGKEKQRETELARERAKKLQAQAKLQSAQQKATSSAATTTAKPTAPIDNVDFNLDSSSAITALGIAAAGFGVAAAGGILGDGTGDDKTTGKSRDSFGPVSPSSAGVMATSPNIIVGRNGTLSLGMPPAADGISPIPPFSRQSEGRGRGMDEAKDVPTATSASGVDEELRKLEESQRAMDNFLMQDSAAAASRNGESNAGSSDTIIQELDHLEAAQKAMNEYLDMDDGANDWLQVLAEIRDEPDEEVDRINGESRRRKNDDKWDIPFEFPSED